MKRRTMFYRMVTASLMRRRSRMLIALLAVAIGATILSGLMTIYFDVPRQMGAQFRNYGANLIFTPTQSSFLQEDLDEGLSYFDSKALVGATAFRYETVRIHEQPIIAAGTSMEDVLSTSPYWSVDGALPTASLQVLVGKKVAENLNLSIGDKVEISYTPEAEEGQDADTVVDNFDDYKVTGILNTGGSEEDYVYIAMKDLEDLTGTDPHIDLAEVSVSASSVQLAAYIESINENVSSIRAEAVKRVTASETSVLSKLQSLVLLVTVIVLALTMVCVATTMTAVVTERRKEIGLRKALGATDGGLIREFMGESVLLGALGGILGAIVGFVFAQIVSVNVFGSSISFRPLLAILTILVSIIITAVTCILPIRSATRVDPALVLKGE